MQQLDTGVRGAKVQSWRAANPRDLLKRVIESNPGSDRAGLLTVFRDALFSNPESGNYLDSIIEYWFSNNYHSLVGQPPSPARASARLEISRATEQIRERVAKKIKEEAQIALLEMAMPNGKALKDCTGSECRKLAPRIGSWLAKVGARVKSTQRVGEALTEDQLRALY